MKQSRCPSVVLCLLAFGAFSLVHRAHGADGPPAPSYHLTHEVALPGTEGWDYLVYDAGRRGGAGARDAAGGASDAAPRVLVSHGTRVQVLDGDKLSLLGEIADTPGVHGIALAPDLGRGYISAGRADLVVVFDLKSLARVTEIKVTGANPDAILYEPTTHRIFTFNGRGRNATAIDAVKNEVIGTLPLDAKPEFSVTDGAGHVFVNLEDKNSIAVIDPQKLTVLSVWPVEGCDEPSGLAIDAANHRLFTVCGNKVMAVVDSTSGKVVAKLPIGGRVDAASYDPTTHLAFASCGDGTMTVVRESTPNDFAVVQTVTTKAGARTMTLDERTHRVFLPTATALPGTPAAPAATAAPAAAAAPNAPPPPRAFSLMEFAP